MQALLPVLHCTLAAVCMYTCMCLQAPCSTAAPPTSVAAPACRMPIGGPKGGPLEVTLTRAKFDDLAGELYRRCRLPLDQAAWQAGVELQELLMELEAKKAELSRRGVPQWKQQMLQVCWRFTCREEAWLWWLGGQELQPNSWHLACCGAGASRGVHGAGSGPYRLVDAKPICFMRTTVRKVFGPRQQRQRPPIRLLLRRCCLPARRCRLGPRLATH